MSQNKNICDHIKLTKRTWNDEREKRQEGKLHRGRPQKLNTEQAKDHGETLELQGNRYYDATTIVQSLDISVARQAKQGDHSHKQSTVFKSANNRTNNYKHRPKGRRDSRRFTQDIGFSRQRSLHKLPCAPKGVQNQKETRRNSPGNSVVYL